MSSASPPVRIAPDAVLAAAGVATAGVAAQLAARAARCDNCGACGQRVEPPVHSLWLSLFYLLCGTLMLALTTAYSYLTV
jgi:uncharacterized membrane protein YdcZ (DUF606 family)